MGECGYYLNTMCSYMKSPKKKGKFKVHCYEYIIKYKMDIWHYKACISCMCVYVYSFLPFHLHSFVFSAFF